MRALHLIFPLVVTAFLLCGCEFLLSEARKIAGTIDDGDGDSGTDAGADASVEDDAGGVDAGEGLPGPEEIWVRLNVECTLAACAQPRQLIFYAYDGTVDKTGPVDMPNYYHVFSEVTFPFTVLLKSTQNTLFVAKQWPETPIAGGAYYDLQPGDNIAARIDPQNRNNIFQFEKGKINVIDLVLDAVPQLDESWMELSVECEEDPCTVSKNLIFYAYDGTDDGTFRVPQLTPNYYLSFSEVSFPFKKLLKTAADKSGNEKDWPVDAVITGGAYYDTDSTDSVIASKFDPQDLRNRITLKGGEIVKVKLMLHGYPAADEAWVELNVACTLPQCLEDKTLRFYMYDGPVEPSWYPTYYQEWQNAIFPFKALLTHSYTVPNPTSVEEPWPAGQVTGGAFYDMNPEDGYAMPVDPADRYNTYTFQKGIINYVDLELDIDAGLRPDSGT